MDNMIHFILYGIIYKLVDDFYDEEIYNEYFPNVNIVLHIIIITYSIYLFYFNTEDNAIFLFLFLSEIYYILFLCCNYFGYNDIVKLAEINLTIYDPFTLLSIFLLPNFIIHFHKVIYSNYEILLILFVCFIFIGIFQDLDNSLLGKYVFNGHLNNTPYKKHYKLIYRLSIIFIIGLYDYLPNDLYKNIFAFCTSYSITSVISLYIQIILEEHKEHTIFIEKITNIKKTCKHVNV